MLLQQSRKIDYPPASSFTVKMISDKWKKIVNEIDQQKISRNLEIQERMKLLEKQALTVNNSNFQQIQDSINQLSCQVNEFITTDSNEKNMKSFSNIQNQVTKNLEQQKQQTKEIETRLHQQLEWSNIKDYITRNESQFGYHTQRKVALIADSINQIEDAIKEEKEQRNESFLQIEDELDQRLQQLQKQIQIESQVRRQTENKIFDMITDVHQNLTQMVLDEKRQRQIMNDNLMQLIDEACLRIDKNLNTF